MVVPESRILCSIKISSSPGERKSGRLEAHPKFLYTQSSSQLSLPCRSPSPQRNLYANPPFSNFSASCFRRSDKISHYFVQQVVRLSRASAAKREGQPRSRSGDLLVLVRSLDRTIPTQTNISAFQPSALLLFLAIITTRLSSQSQTAGSPRCASGR